MTAFTPETGRTIEARFERGRLVSVLLWQRGEKLKEYVPSLESEWHVGSVLYHHANWENLKSGSTGSGFLWMVQHIFPDESGDVILTNLRGGDREDSEVKYLNRGIEEGFISVLKIK